MYQVFFFPLLPKKVPGVNLIKLVIVLGFKNNSYTCESFIKLTQIAFEKKSVHARRARYTEKVRRPKKRQTIHLFPWPFFFITSFITHIIMFLSHGIVAGYLSRKGLNSQHILIIVKI